MAAEVLANASVPGLQVQLYDASGVAQTPALEAANNPGARVDDFTLTALNHGSYVVTWRSEVDDFTADTKSLTLHSQVFSAVGMAIG